MTVKKLKRYPDIIALAVIFVAASISTIIWAATDQTPPSWDPSDHISAAYDYHRFLADGRLDDFLQDFFSASHYYAPLVHLVTAMVFLALGASRVAAIVVNIISLAVLLASVYSIARMIYNSREATEDSGNRVDTARWSGVMAALLVTCYHFPAWLIHDAFLDYPLIAIVALTFALLMRADDFRVRKRALAFGAAAGLGLLTKQPFAFFFVLPALYVCLRVIRSRERRAIINLALSASLALAIAAIWYLPHLNDVIAIYQVNSSAAASERDAPVFGFHSLYYYSGQLLNSQLQLPFAMLFLFGLRHSITRQRKQSVMLYLWIMSGLLVFTLLANKDERYLVPILPAVALISVCWMNRSDKSRADEPERRRWSKERWRPVALFGIAAWATVSFINAQWPMDGSGLLLDMQVVRIRVLTRNYYVFDHRPLPHSWGVPEAVRVVANDWHNSRKQSQLIVGDAHYNTVANSETTSDADARQERERPVLGVAVNLPYLNPSSLSLHSRLLSTERAGPPLILISSLAGDSEVGQIEECDYVLVRSGFDSANRLAPVEQHVEELIRASSRRFTRIASFPLPFANAEAVVYKILN